MKGRLVGRRTEAEDQVKKRLAKAEGEIAIARDSGCYQHFVVNDRLEDAIEQVKSVIREENSTA